MTLDGLIEELPGWQLLAADQERPAGEAALALAADRLPEGWGLVEAIQA